VRSLYPLFDAQRLRFSNEAPKHQRSTPSTSNERRWRRRRHRITISLLPRASGSRILFSVGYTNRIDIGGNRSNNRRQLSRCSRLFLNGRGADKTATPPLTGFLALIIGQIFLTEKANSVVTLLVLILCDIRVTYDAEKYAEKYEIDSNGGRSLATRYERSRNTRCGPFAIANVNSTADRGNAECGNAHRQIRPQRPANFIFHLEKKRGRGESCANFRLDSLFNTN